MDFRHWLQYTYPFIYENMCDAYELDVKRFVQKFTPPAKPIEEIISYDEELENGEDDM